MLIFKSQYILLRLWKLGVAITPLVEQVRYTGKHLGTKEKNFIFDTAKRLNLAENVYISEKYLDDSAWQEKTSSEIERQAMVIKTVD